MHWLYFVTMVFKLITNTHCLHIFCRQYFFNSLIVNKMNLSVKPVFSFNLNHKTTPGIVTIGKYDGTHACLTAATSADKV